MNYVRRPKKTIFMADPVKPVITKIIGQKNQYPGPPGKGDGKKPIFNIHKGQHA